MCLGEEWHRREVSGATLIGWLDEKWEGRNLPRLGSEL